MFGFFESKNERYQSFSKIIDDPELACPPNQLGCCYKLHG